MSEILPIVIRGKLETDIPYIRSTWLNHYKNNSAVTKHIRARVFIQQHRKIVDRILSNEKTLVRIAALKEDSAIIVGYLVMEIKMDTPIMHYVYVKEAFREFGIAKKLLGDIDLINSVITHWSFNCTDWISDRLQHKLIYDPYILMKG